MFNKSDWCDLLPPEGFPLRPSVSKGDSSVTAKDKAEKLFRGS